MFLGLVAPRLHGNYVELLPILVRELRLVLEPIHVQLAHARHEGPVLWLVQKPPHGHRPSGMIDVPHPRIIPKGLFVVVVLAANLIADMIEPPEKEWRPDLAHEHLHVVELLSWRLVCRPPIGIFPATPFFGAPNTADSQWRLRVRLAIRHGVEVGVQTTVGVQNGNPRDVRAHHWIADRLVRIPELLVARPHERLHLRSVPQVVSGPHAPSTP